MFNKGGAVCEPFGADKARFEALAAALDLDGNNKITLNEVSNALSASSLKSKDANEFAQNFNRAAKTVGSDKQIQM